MVFFIPVQRSQQPSSACPWLHAGPATKRHCGSPPPKRGRDLISPRPSEHRLLQLRHLGCCECKKKPWGQDLQTAAGKWSESEMMAKCVDTIWHMHSMKLRQVVSLPGSEKLRFTIYYIVQPCHLQSLSRGGIGIAHLSHWTITKHILPYAPLQSEKKKQAHLNHGTSRSCDETVVWQSLKLLNKSSERKSASRITTRRCRVAI